MRVRDFVKRLKNEIKKTGVDDYYNIKIGGEFSYQRPTDSYLPLGVHDVAKIPLIPYSMRFLYDLMFFSTTLRTVVRALVWEIFRNGIDIVPRFACKCTVCGSEFNEVYRVCPHCGSDKLRYPNRKQYMKLKSLMRRCNLNNDSLLDVLRDICYDGAVTDNMFLCVMKRYYYDEDGRLIGAEPVEILRGSPMKIRLIMSKDGRMGFTDDGRVVCFCPEHRKECEIVSRDEFARGVKCKKCGKYMMPAWYETITGAGFNMFYAPGEILHAKMFTPGIGYGVSPILTVMIKVIVLMKMDWFVMTAYHLQRPPKGLLVLRGSRESISKAWQWLMEQARLNPHMIYPLIIEGTEQMSSKRVAEWIDLSVKAQDIAFTEYRDEIRKAIGACYDEETELLTENGWKRWNEIKVGEKALTCNPATGRMRWIKIRDVKVFDWDGEVLEIENDDYSLVVTPEHRMVFFEKRSDKNTRMSMVVGRAGEIRKFSGYYIVSGEIDGGKRFECEGFDSDAVLEAIMLARCFGYVSMRSRKICLYYAESGKEPSEELLEYLEELSERLGLTLTKRDYKGNVRYYLRSIPLSKIVAKYVNELGELKELSAEQLERMVSAFLRVAGVGRSELQRVNEGALDEAQEIFLKCGYKMKILGSNSVECGVGRFVVVNEDDVKIRKYTGKVWDVDCGGHYVVVRRKGKVAIQSNCFGVMPLFVGDTKGIGGLNSEGMQVLVTNRTVEAWQRLYNDKFFPWLVEQLGITDYELKLRPNEIRDEATESELNIKKVQLAGMIASLGYDVRLENKGGKIELRFGEKETYEKLKDLVRELARDKKVNAAEILSTIERMLNGEQVSTVSEDDKSYGAAELGTVADLLTQMNVEESKRDYEEEKRNLRRFSGEPDRRKVRREEQRFGGEPDIPKR